MEVGFVFPGFALDPEVSVSGLGALAGGVSGLVSWLGGDSAPSSVPVASTRFLRGAAALGLGATSGAAWGLTVGLGGSAAGSFGFSSTGSALDEGAGAAEAEGAVDGSGGGVALA